MTKVVHLNYSLTIVAIDHCLIVYLFVYRDRGITYVALLFMHYCQEHFSPFFREIVSLLNSYFPIPSRVFN